MDWEAIGAIAAVIALIGTGIGWLLTWRRRVRSQAPTIEFSEISFAGPGEHPRVEYRYAFGVRLTNVGGGPARRLHWGFIDEDEQWFAEMVHRDVPLPSQSTEDWSGIRGQKQTDDPVEEEARAFYDRCLLFAECWDTRQKHYLFFPFGGGRAPDPHGGAFSLRENMSQFPSRGEARKSLGAGRVDQAFGQRQPPSRRRR